VLDVLNYLATAKSVWAPSKIYPEGDMKAAIKLAAYAAAVEEYVDNHYYEVMGKVLQQKAKEEKSEAKAATARAHAKLHTPSHFLVRGAKGLINATGLRTRNQGLRHQK